MALLAGPAPAGCRLAPTTTQLVRAPRPGADRRLEEEREQLSSERFDTVGFWAGSFVADPARISLLHRYGDLALPELWKVLSGRTL